MRLGQWQLMLGSQFDWYLPHLKWLGLDADELAGVEPSRGNLDGVTLSGVDLRGANLKGANLSGVDFYRANLRGVNLSGAILYGANLRGANIYAADLDGAYLCGALGIVSFGPVGTEGHIGYIVAGDDDADHMVYLSRWDRPSPLSATLETLRADGSTGYVAIVEAAALVLSEQGGGQ